MLNVRFALSLRNVEDLLFERGSEVCHETVRLWWKRLAPMFTAEIRRQRVNRMRGFRRVPESLAPPPLVTITDGL